MGDSSKNLVILEFSFNIHYTRAQSRFVALFYFLLSHAEFGRHATHAGSRRTKREQRSSDVEMRQSRSFIKEDNRCLSSKELKRDCSILLPSVTRTLTHASPSQIVDNVDDSSGISSKF